MAMETERDREKLSPTSMAGLEICQLPLQGGIMKQSYGHHLGAHYE